MLILIKAKTDRIISTSLTSGLIAISHEADGVCERKELPIAVV